MDASLTQEQLLLIYNNTSDLVFLIEVLGRSRYRVESVNRAYLKRTQLASGDIIGLPIHAVLRDEQLRYVTDRYDAAIAHGGPFRYETRTSMGGATVYLDTTLVPVFGPDNTCTHLIGVSRDVTQTKLEQRALRREKQRNENYLQIAEAVILAVDTSCNITLLNRKGYAMLGYPEGSLTGHNWIDLVIAADKAGRFWEQFRRIIASGVVPEKNVNYVRTRTGQRLLISWANALIRADDGSIAGILSSGEDISDRHRAEQALIASQRVLAADEVVSAVAHDFNNSLQGILGNIELALAVADQPERLSRFLQTASKLADDAARRLEVLRGARATEAARGYEPLDLHELIEDVIAQTQPLWKDEAQRHGRDIRLKRNFSATLGPTLGNRSELRSVLYNIVKNSIEAVPREGEVVFGTACHDGFNVLTITDTGIGMDTDTHARIFQPFFSTKGLEAGRGLGMSASHRIVLAHRGELSVKHSAPGLGTTMELRLPAVTEGPALAGMTATAAARQRHNVLWVDDDPEIAALAASYLAALHHSGDVAANGSQALELLRANGYGYSVVITDVGMPGMSGLELARQVSAITAGRLPIIVLTGWGDSVRDLETLPAGIHQVVSKPIRLDRLRQILDGLPALPVSS